MNSVTPQNAIHNGRDIPVTVSVFRSEKDNVPKAETGTLADLFGDGPIIRATKAGTACYSPAVYRPEAKRGNDGVAWITAGVIDLDHISTDQLLRACDWMAPYAGAIHSSYSDLADGPEDRCARIFMPFSRWISPEEWKLVWTEVVRQIGVPVDEHTADPARIWYLPSCPESRAPTAYVSYTSGVLLNPDPLIAAARAAAPADQLPKKSANQFLHLVSSEATKGARHGAIVQLAGHLVGKGVDPKVTLHLLLAWNRQMCTPPKPDSEVVAAVNYVAGKELTRPVKGGRRGQ